MILISAIRSNIFNKLFFTHRKVNGSCDGDVGWLMVSVGKICKYEMRHSSATFMYSKLDTSVNWNEYGKILYKIR